MIKWNSQQIDFIQRWFLLNSYSNLIFLWSLVLQCLVSPVFTVTDITYPLQHQNCTKVSSESFLGGMRCRTVHFFCWICHFRISLWHSFDLILFVVCSFNYLFVFLLSLFELSEFVFQFLWPNHKGYFSSLPRRHRAQYRPTVSMRERDPSQCSWTRLQNSHKTWARHSM